MFNYMEFGGHFEFNVLIFWVPGLPAILEHPNRDKIR